MRHKIRVSYINSVILGRRKYRERLSRLLLQGALQAVDQELSRFAADVLARCVQADPEERLQAVHALSDANAWRAVCDKLSQHISWQLARYFQRPVSAFVVNAPVLSPSTMPMVTSLYNEACLTRSASILAEHLLSNVWGSFHIPKITAIGNEIVSELVNAGAKMLRQFNLCPEQMQAAQLAGLQEALVGRLAAGLSQVRSAVAVTLYHTIRDMNRVTYLEKYDRMLRSQPAADVHSLLRLAAD